MPRKDKEERNQYQKKWRERNHERDKEKNRKYRRKYVETHREKIREFARNKSRSWKVLILSHYGGEHPQCECCGESESKFLTVDHIKGGGKKHRKAIGKHGNTFYRWLVQNEYPSGFRILCYNCNCASGHWGKCPHEEMRKNGPERSNLRPLGPSST